MRNFSRSVQIENGWIQRVHPTSSVRRTRWVGALAGMLLLLVAGTESLAMGRYHMWARVSFRSKFCRARRIRSAAMTHVSIFKFRRESGLIRSRSSSTALILRMTSISR
jgi:hypothetical protein